MIWTLQDVNMSSPKMKPVLMDYQRFMGMEETGTLDQSTMDMMNMPRCGVPDNILPQLRQKYQMIQNNTRFRRYTLQGSVWPTKNLTWKVTQYSHRDNLRGKDRDIDRIIEYALKV